MDKNMIYQKLLEIIPQKNLLLDEPMKKHTSFKIGGPADIMVLASSIGHIQKTLSLCEEYNIPYYIIGNGSNLLVRDKGMRCVVIKIADQFNHVTIDGTKVIAQAGVLLSTLSKRVLKECLKGFEFASGIPGTLGGAITMNAGAYGGEMKDVIKSCTILDENHQIKTLSLEELKLGYRTSVIQEKGYVLLEAELELEKGRYEDIKEIIDDLTEKRTTKQPLHLPSAGSVFKRPVGYYAGKLIQDSNLRGVKIGGAQVSELHSGFIVNVGDATAEDVLNLIAFIQKVVKEKFGVELQPEVRVVGEE